MLCTSVGPMHAIAGDEADAVLVQQAGEARVTRRQWCAGAAVCAGAAGLAGTSFAEGVPSWDTGAPRIYEQMRGSVVAVRAMGKTSGKVLAQGSGFVWDCASGVVVTSFRNVRDAAAGQGEPQRFLISLPRDAPGLEDEEAAAWGSGASWEGEALLVGAAPSKDVAVLQMKASSSPVTRRLKGSRIGTSEDVRVGQSCFAIGSGWAAGTATLGRGVVGGLGRAVPSPSGAPILALQSDALAPATGSGGPLLDSAARVVGMTTAGYGAGSGGNAGGSGVAFFVPIDLVTAAVPAILASAAESPQFQDALAR